MHQTSPAIQATILIKLANYSTERMSIDLYYLNEAVHLMTSDYGEENLRKEIPNFDEKFRRLNYIDKLLAKSKIFYDAIENKKFDKMKSINSVNKYFVKQYYDNARKIAVLQKDLYDLFVYLVNHSTIQSQTLRSEYLKVIEYGSTKINTDKARALERGK